MDEDTARAVVLVRAIETADGARDIWTDVDRQWAGRAAAESVGENAPDDAFLGRRSELALARLGERYPKARALARAPALHRPLALLAPAAAFVLGVLGVDIGPEHRINLLAPPVLALLAWNVAVYVLLAVAALSHRAPEPGGLRQRIAAWLRDASIVRQAPLPLQPLGAAAARFATDWTALAAPLWQSRAARLMHVCAAALAAGAIAGLYLRGIALEYRAGWQSTFLDANDVARLLRTVLAPGSWLTGIPVPGAAHLRTLAGGSAGEIAAPWIHLYAATLLLVVIVPRLALAALALARERRLRRQFPLALEQPYFRRLLQAWREGPAGVVAVPYSFDVPRQCADGFARVTARAFESAVDVIWTRVVAYGADVLPELPARPLAAVVGVFQLAATPERENHVAFLGALAALAARRAPLAAVVDASEFAARFGDQPQRIAEREALWREALAPLAVEPLFVRLADPDVAKAGAAFAARVERAAS